MKKGLGPQRREDAKEREVFLNWRCARLRRGDTGTGRSTEGCADGQMCECVNEGGGCVLQGIASRSFLAVRNDMHSGCTDDEWLHKAREASTGLRQAQPDSSCVMQEYIETLSQSLTIRSLPATKHPRARHCEPRSEAEWEAIPGVTQQLLLATSSIVRLSLAKPPP